MRFLSATFLFTTCLLPMVAMAEYIEPGDVSVKTTRYEPSKTDFTAGTYKYAVAWQGITVAEAEVEVKSGAVGATGVYDVTARAETEGMVSVFYKMRHQSNSVFDAGSLRPLKFESYQKERKREKSREVSFTPEGVIEFSSKKNGQLKSSKSFRTENFTLDPISAAFVARSLPIKLGTEASFDVFNGKHRYLITCRVDKREKIEIGGRMIDAFRVVPSVDKLTDSKTDKRLESAVIWISADSARHVLKLESKVWVGSVTAELSGFAASPATAPGSLIRASLK